MKSEVSHYSKNKRCHRGIKKAMTRKWYAAMVEGVELETVWKQWEDTSDNVSPIFILKTFLMKYAHFTNEAMTTGRR